MHDTELTRRRLADLRTIGVSLAVDDFGTGYSSLQYVQRFPIDIIKIDRSFVSGLGEQAGDVVVVQSMIELAQRLGVHTVAEGIERRRADHDPAVARRRSRTGLLLLPARHRRRDRPRCSPGASSREPSFLYQ